MGKLKDALLNAEESYEEEIQDALRRFDYYKIAELTYKASEK